MEQLQRLAEAIADTYIRDRIREHGNAQFSYDGKTGEVRPHLLACGLVDICVYEAKNKGHVDFEREAYAMLMNMISLDGREYQLTNHGLTFIDHMQCRALSKGTVRISH